MTKSIKTTLILLALTFTTLSAKNGYDYYYYGNGGATYNKLNKSSISKIAKKEIKRLILEKKLPKSWKSMPITKIKKSNSNDWMVIFNNLKIRNKSKQNLYVFVDLYGHVEGANYTGH
jgi:Family of unknown function (DUF6488)